MTMKIQRLDSTIDNRISSYGIGYFTVADQRYETSLVVDHRGGITPWTVASAEDLDANVRSELLQAEPDIVIIGTGSRQRFPHPAWLEGFLRLGVGVEVMDSRAACRTFNILRSEDRAVVAALMLVAR